MSFLKRIGGLKFSGVRWCVMACFCVLNLTGCVTVLPGIPPVDGARYIRTEGSPVRDRFLLSVAGGRVNTQDGLAIFNPVAVSLPAGHAVLFSLVTEYGVVEVTATGREDSLSLSAFGFDFSIDYDQHEGFPVSLQDFKLKNDRVTLLSGVDIEIQKDF